MTSAQLELFEAIGGGDIVPAPTLVRPLNRAEAGLVKEIGPGAERLLAALVLHGLDREFLRPAAALAVALDEPRGKT